MRATTKTCARAGGDLARPSDARACSGSLRSSRQEERDRGGGTVILTLRLFFAAIAVGALAILVFLALAA
jgi:hypothetical protein